MENEDVKKDYGTVINTLKELYASRKIDVSQIRKMLSDGKITIQEYEYIITR